MIGIIGTVLSLAVQGISMWMTMKGKASALDKKWLKWIEIKNKDATKSAKLKEKIEAALKWDEDHPVKKGS